MLLIKRCNGQKLSLGFVSFFFCGLLALQPQVPGLEPVRLAYTACWQRKVAQKGNMLLSLFDRALKGLLIQHLKGSIINADPQLWKTVQCLLGTWCTRLLLGLLCLRIQVLTGSR